MRNGSVVPWYLPYTMTTVCVDGMVGVLGVMSIVLVTFTCSVRLVTLPIIRYSSSTFRRSRPPPIIAGAVFSRMLITRTSSCRDGRVLKIILKVTVSGWPLKQMNFVTSKVLDETPYALCMMIVCENYVAYCLIQVHFGLDRMTHFWHFHIIAKWKPGRSKIRPHKDNKMPAEDANPHLY